MGVPEVLSALAQQWERVDAALDPASRAALRDLVVELDSVAEEDEHRRLRVQSDIAALVLRGLPENDPVVVLGSRLVTGGVVDLRSVARALHARLTGQGPIHARHHILNAPWRTAIELRSDGIDPDLPDLIRLNHTRDGCAVPSFQFDAAGTAIPVVLAVNQVLDARHDPWGAAYWWLSTNVWLAERPSDLIDSAAPQTLVAVAVAAVEG